MMNPVAFSITSVALLSSIQAATWDGSADALWTNTANWSDNAAPNGTISYDGTSLANLTQSLNGSHSVTGIAVNAGTPGAVTINNGTGTNTLTLGSGGISLAATGQNLTFGTGYTLAFGAAQTWSVGTGRTLQFNAAITAANNIGISGGGTTTLNGATFNGTATFTGANTFSLNNNTVSFAGGADFGGATQTFISNNEARVVSTGAATALSNGTMKVQGNAMQFNAATTGVFTLEGGTSGQIILNSTAINNTQLNVNLASSTSALRLAAPFSSGTAQIGNFTGVAGSFVSTNFGAGTTTRTLQVNQSTNGTFAGLLTQGSGRALALDKRGSATLELTGIINNYTGGTTVTAGTLLANNTSGSATGSGAVDVGASGTFGGTGSVSGQINVTGVLAPGASIESLGSGNLNFLTGSTFAYEMDSASLNGDLLDSTGTLDIASGSILTLTQLASGTLANDSKLTLISYMGGWTNSELFTYLGNTLADDSTFTLGDNQWRFDYNDTAGGSNFIPDQSGATSFVTMTVVPEPSVAGLLGGLGVITLLRRRRTGSSPASG